MPLGTCDPASRGDEFNVTELAKFNGAILISVRWGWDGESTMETGCDGPIEDIRVVNTSLVSFYALLPMKRRGERWLEIPPGTDRIYNRNQARQAGLETAADVEGVLLSSVPTAL